MDIQRLNQEEDALIRSFESHPVLSGLQRMNKADMRQLLLEEAVMSFQFPEFCDLTVIGLDKVKSDVRDSTLQDAAESAVKTVRSLYLEEVHPELHRRQLAEDLSQFGVDRSRVIETVLRGGSKATKRTRKGFGIFLRQKPDTSAEEYGMQLLAALRLGHEALVSVEYRKFLERMKELGFDEEKSVFYAPHRDHDEKRSALHEVSESPVTHSDYIVGAYQKFLFNETQIRAAVRISRGIVRVRSKFYDQFTPLG